MRAFLVLLVLAVAAFSGAAKFETHRYDVDLSITKRGDITFVETISVTFTERQRGLILKRPYRTRSGNGKIREVRYTFEEATIERNGSREKIEANAKETRGNWELRLGSPNKWISGDATYRVRYKVKGAMTPFYKQDHIGLRSELLWNLLPADWPTSIPASTMTIVYPKPHGGVLRARVLAGPKGTRQGIELDYNGKRVGRSEFIDVNFLESTKLEVKLKKTLPAGSLVTAALILPGDTVEPSDPMIYSESSGERIHASASDGNPIRASSSVPLWFAAIPFLPGLVAFLVARRSWAARPRPLVVRFDPPPGIGPSMAGTVIDETVNQHDVVAGIVSLAQKGAMKIHHPQDSSEGVSLELLGPQRAKDADQVEQYLYSALAQYGPWITPEMLRGTFGEQYQTVSNLLSAEARERGLFIGHTASRPVIGCLLIGFTALAAFGLCLFQPLSLVGGLLGLVLGFFGLAKVTNLTRTGQEVKRDLEGLKEFIMRAHKRELNYMADVMPDQAMFERLLPYAVAFNAVQLWTKAFEGIDLQMPDWYDAPMGTDIFWTSMLLHDLTSVQHDYGQAMSSTMPVSDFGSGDVFSSGDSAFGGSWSDSDSGGGFDGGFSAGDGGGGGGGDSW